MAFYKIGKGKVKKGWLYWESTSLEYILAIDDKKTIYRITEKLPNGQRVYDRVSKDEFLMLIINYNAPYYVIEKVEHHIPI